MNMDEGHESLNKNIPEEEQFILHLKDANIFFDPPQLK